MILLSLQKVTMLWMLLILASLMLVVTNGFVPNPTLAIARRSIAPTERINRGERSACSSLFMSLKPAAVPMMDSGKALARSGELLVDLTTELGLYGGALSAAGAQIRNAGDAVAQAAASCRFKTAAELVCDELREAATCLEEAAGKMVQAKREAEQDEQETLQKELDAATLHVSSCSKSLEAAGAGIMQKKSLNDIGMNLVASGESMKQLSTSIQALAPNCEEAQVSGQRMAFAAERMIVAGNDLQGKTEKPKKGKAWLRG